MFGINKYYVTAVMNGENREQRNFQSDAPPYYKKH